MEKFSLSIALFFVTFAYHSLAGPIEVEKSSSTDDLKTSETFGYGYYQPNIYSAPLVTHTVPLATTSVVAAPLASGSAGYARSGYGYDRGYKYGSGYGYDNRWGYGNAGTVNEFYRRHPVYVAWG